MSATSGKLKLFILEAHLTRDTDTWSKMDPYCVISTRMQRIRTKTCNKGGKNPTWANECMDVDVKYVGDDMNLQIFDEDMTNSDLVGQATVKLSSFCVGTGIDDWFDIQHKGKSAGRVHLRSEWHPDGQALMQIDPNQQFVPPPIRYSDGSAAMINSTAPQPHFYQQQPQMGYPQQQQYPPQ
jgi:Ca2+-dependent lipid-binding protein